MCVRTGSTQYSISLDVLADQNIFVVGVTISIVLDVKIALPEDLFGEDQARFHDLHVIFPVRKGSPLCL